VDVMFVAMHAAAGKQAEDMQRAIVVLGGVDGCRQCRIGEEIAIADGAVDAFEFLVENPSRTDVEMTDFGVAHLAGGQADGVLGGIDEGVGVSAPERIPVWLVRQSDGVVRGFLAMAEAVQNQQQNRSDFHLNFSFLDIPMYKPLLFYYISRVFALYLMGIKVL
jgi:hypothetical protein